MAGNILAGFVKGFSGTMLDDMKAREEAERQEKRDRMLEQLRRETAEEMLILQEKFDKRKVDKDLSEEDFTSGERIMRNEYGEEIGRSALPQSALQDRELGLTKERLGIENLRSTISSRSLDDARADRIATAQIGAYGSGGHRRGLDSIEGSEGQEILLAEANRAFASMAAAGANPYQLARGQEYFDAMVNGIEGDTGAKRKPASPDEQRRFLRALRRSLIDDARKSEAAKPAEEI